MKLNNGSYIGIEDCRTCSSNDGLFWRLDIYEDAIMLEEIDSIDKTNIHRTQSHIFIKSELEENNYTFYFYQNEDFDDEIYYSYNSTFLLETKYKHCGFLTDLDGQIILWIGNGRIIFKEIK